MQTLTRKAQIRQSFISQAEALLSKSGFNNANKAHKVKTNNVSNAAMFVHFATRQDLILTVVTSFGDRLNAEIVLNSLNFIREHKSNSYSFS